MKMMQKLKHLSLATLLLGGISLASCGGSQTTTESDTASTGSTAETGSLVTDTAGGVAEAVITGTKPDTTVTGTVRFTHDAAGRVKMNLDITVPKKANQSVAVHIHEHGDCGEMGNNAHGHWNPTKSPHGKWAADSFHVGDIGNVSLNAEGKGTMELETDLWTIGGDSTKNILNKAIIVHGGVDDYTSQPTGNAGTRIGCGVIKRS